MPISGLVYGRGAMCWVHVYVDVWQRKGQINRAINTGEIVRRVLGSRFCFGVRTLREFCDVAKPEKRVYLVQKKS